MARGGLGSFLNSFVTTMQVSQAAKQDKELRDLKVKTLKNQLELEDRQREARQDLDVFTSDPGFEGKNLIDALSTNRGLDLALKSGLVKLTDVPALQQQSASSKLLDRFASDGMPGQGPGGLELSAVKFDTSGKPMLDFTKPQVKREVPDSTGKNILSLDERGNVISSRPASPQEISLTPAQKAIDTKFAEEYTDFKVKGGFADIQKGLGQLEDAKKLLSENNLTGPFVGQIPDSLLNVFNPKAVSTREQVEEVVQRNLRLVLGAQFTKEEGERLIARSYNPKLSEEENKIRLDRLINQIKRAAQAKVDAINYYEENGTLAGFTGKIFTMADFENTNIAGKEIQAGRFKVVEE